MGHQKLSELLNDSTVWKFATRIYIRVNDLLGVQYAANKYIRFNTPMLTSNLCGYSAAYIFVKGKITVQITNANNQED